MAMRFRSEGQIALPLLLALALAGCLEKPTGLQKKWPPPVTVDVAGIAAGDLDADGLDDLVVVIAGTPATGGGVYFLKGGTDLDPLRGGPAGGLISGFSEYAPIGEVLRPLGLEIIDVDPATPGREVIILNDSSEGSRLSILSGATLLEVKSYIVPAPRQPSNSPPPWLRVIPFGTAGRSLFVGSGPNVRQLPIGELFSFDAPAIIPLAAPAGEPNFRTPQFIANIGGSANKVMVAGDTQAWTTDMTGATVGWKPVRTSSSPWFGQVPMDLNADGVEEIVGIARTAVLNLCATNVATPQEASCLATSSPLQSDKQKLIGDHLIGDPSTGIEAVVVQGSNVTVYPSLRIDSAANAVVSDPPTSPFIAPFPDPQVVTADFVKNGPRQILLMGTAGELECLRVSATNTLAKCIAVR
jgi:hypothetical protein